MPYKFHQYGYVRMLKRDDSRARGAENTARHAYSPRMSELFDWDRAIDGFLNKVLPAVYGPNWRHKR